MESIEVVSAGYFGVVPGPPVSWLDPKYVGGSLLSLSDELVTMVPGPSWTDTAVEDQLVHVGVAREMLADAAAWLDDAYRRGNILFPNVFRRPSVLMDFLGRFAVDSPVRILGAALDADERDRFLGDHERESGRADGVIEMLRLGEPLAPGYRILGYEPVEVTCAAFGSSWTINLLQPQVDAATGVTPNPDGFISTSEEACAVMAYLSQPTVGKEPAVWRAWLVVSYPRETTRRSVAIRRRGPSQTTSSDSTVPAAPTPPRSGALSGKLSSRMPTRQRNAARADGRLAIDASSQALFSSSASITMMPLGPRT